MNNSISLSKSNNRNIGIECLRMLSMLMVVTLHCLGHGGVLKSTYILSANYNAAWLLEIACYGAVDLYALITGYVCVESKHKWSRIAELWLQVALYSISFAILFYFLPEYKLGKTDVIKSCFPIMDKQYWYFSSYFCLFLFMPFINSLLSHLSKLQHRKLIFTGIIAFCFIALFARFIGGDVFNVHGGYSFLWLAFMYIVGAYLKFYPEDIEKYSKKRCLSGYFICILCAWCSELLINKIMGKTKYSALFISYISPFIVLGAICLFLFFLRLNINRGKKFITQASSVSFGVYLISENTYVWNAFVKDKFIKYIDRPWYLMICYVLFGAIIIYICCSFIDYIRKCLFSLLHIRSLCDGFFGFVKSRAVKGVDRPKCGG